MWRRPPSLGQFLVFVIMAGVSVTSTSLQHGEGEEWCNYETFRASCDEQNEVILMEHALYGRMKLGRCVTTDFGFLGCSANVLDLLDKKCSGRPACQVEVIRPNFEDRQNCNADLLNYLEARYKCIRVPTVSSTSCVMTAVDSPLYIPSPYINHLHPMQDTACGSFSSPWILQAQPGQQLNVTLLDLMWSNRLQQEVDFDHHCESYGKLTEREQWISASLENARDICSVRSQRLSHVITSRGHELELVLHSPGSHHFILIINAIGCPNLTGLSEGSHVAYSENRLTARVSCTRSRQTWNLACDNNKWQGLVGNCSITGKQPNKQQQNNKKIFSTAMLVVIVVAVSLIICASILLLGVLVYKKFNGKRKYNRPQMNAEELLMSTHSKDNVCAFTPSSEAPPLCQAPDVTQLDANSHSQVQCQIYHALINNECPYMRVVPKDSGGSTCEIHSPHAVMLPERSLRKHNNDTLTPIRDIRYNTHHSARSRSIDSPHYCKYKFNEDSIDNSDPS